MKDVLKLLGWIWGIISIIILSKIILSYLPMNKIENYINMSKMKIIKESRKYSEEIISMNIKERKGFYIKVKKNCSKEGVFFASENEIIRSKRECKEDECKITIEFKEEIPSIIEIYKEQDDYSCKSDVYVTEENMKVLGYVITPELDKLEMEELNITRNDEIVLNKGYRIKGEEGKFYYDKLISEDELIKNGKKTKVNFVLKK